MARATGTAASNRDQHARQCIGSWGHVASALDTDPPSTPVEIPADSIGPPQRTKLLDGDETIWGSSSVLDTVGQLDSRHRNRGFSQTRCIGRPGIEMFTGSIGWGSFT